MKLNVHIVFNKLEMSASMPNTNKCKNTNSVVIELTDILGTLIKLHFLFYKSYIHSLYSQFLIF